MTFRNSAVWSITVKFYMSSKSYCSFILMSALFALLHLWAIRRTKNRKRYVHKQQQKYNEQSFNDGTMSCAIIGVIMYQYLFIHLVQQEWGIQLT